MTDYPWREGAAAGEAPAPGEPSVQPRLEERARLVRERARDVGNALYRGAERARVLAAEGLTWAAGNLRGSSAESSSTARRFADDLERSATYLRQRDMAGMQHDLGDLIKQYPTQSLGAAFVVGWLLGRQLVRR